MPPFFSVIIPTYNRAHKLKKALESLVNQTFTDYEVLVMDDGSTDDTRAVVESFHDARLSYEWAPNFGGPAGPRNRGLKLAKGAYIAFLDSDDWWHPNKLTKCFNLIQLGNDFVYHELEIVRINGKFKKNVIGSWQLRSPVQMDLLMRGNAIATSSVVVRRDIINLTLGFNQSFNMIACEDYHMWLQIAELTEKFHYSAEVLGYYLNDGAGISNKDMSMAYKQAVEPFMHKLSDRQKKYIESMINFQKLKYAYRDKDYGNVMDFAFKSIISGPFHIRVKSAVIYCASLIRY